jgi:hypothetical protein
MNKYLEKIAIRLDMYEHPTDKTKKNKWVADGKTPPFGYVKTKTSTYRRKGQKMGGKKSHK